MHRGIRKMDAPTLFKICGSKTFIVLLCVFLLSGSLTSLATDLPNTWEKLMISGQKAQKSGKHEEAEQLYFQAFVVAEQFGTSDPRFSQSLRALGDLSFARGKLGQAEYFYQRELAILERLGSSYPESATVLAALARIKLRQDQYADAERMLETALERTRKWQSTSTDAEKAAQTYDLAYACFKQKKFAKAEPLFQRALKLKKSARQERGPSLETILLESAQNYIELGKLSAANGCLQDILNTNKGANRRVAIWLIAVANAYCRTNNSARAEVLYKQAIGLSEKYTRLKPVALADLLVRLGNLYMHDKRYAEAEAVYRRSQSILAKASGDSVYDAVATYSLADALFFQDKFIAAEAVYRKALAIEEGLADKEAEQLGHVLVQLAVTLNRLNKQEQVETLFKRAMEILAREPDLKVEYIGTVYQYAAYLQKFKRYNEANELLAQIKRLEGDSKKQAGSK